MSNETKKQAEHNEQVCIHLHGEGIYSDWVVTTAFYSALHFVNFALFPIRVSNIEFKTFNSYYNHLKSKIRASRHKETLDLVRLELGEAAFQLYKWLFDASMTARYQNYKTDRRIADSSILRLNQLKILLEKQGRLD